MTEPPIGGAPQPSSGQPTADEYIPPPGHPPGDEYAPPPPGQPGLPAAPRKKRGLIIASIVLAVVVLLCGGGGLAAFLLLRNAEDGEGAPEPVAAVDGFLKAVYTDQDPAKAAELVCSEARDTRRIARKVEEVKNYSTKYKSPRFRWTTPKVDDQNAGRALVSVKLTMTTADEKTADQTLKLTVVQKTGWWVCEVGTSG